MKSMRVKRILAVLTMTGMLVAGAALPGAAQAASSGSWPYRISRGDTFWKISRKLGVPLDKLMAANANLDAYNLGVGTRINVPAASTAVAAAETTVPSAPQALDFVASAYSAVAAENGGAQWAGLDYFGNSLVQGSTIAVDPQVIPLGSTVYVSGYNWAGLPAGGFVAHATDIGGAIKGNRIDIFLNGSPESLRAFGLQKVKLTLLR